MSAAASAARSAEFVTAHGPVPVERVGFPGFVPTGSVDWLFGKFGLPPRASPPPPTGRSRASGDARPRHRPGHHQHQGGAVRRRTAGSWPARAARCASAYPQPGWAEQDADGDLGQRPEAPSPTSSPGPGPRASPASPSPTSARRWSPGTPRHGPPRRARDPLAVPPHARTHCAALIAAGPRTRRRGRDRPRRQPALPGRQARLGPADSAEGGAALPAQGRLRAGTVDAWLLWNLTAGATFATDHSNASRTQLFDTGSSSGRGALRALRRPHRLPEPRPSDGPSATRRHGPARGARRSSP